MQLVVAHRVSKINSLCVITDKVAHRASAINDLCAITIKIAHRWFKKGLYAQSSSFIDPLLMDFTKPDGRMEPLHIVIQVKIGDFGRRKNKTVMLLRILALKKGAHAQ